MDIEKRIDDLTGYYKKIDKSIENYLPKVAEGSDTDHLEDLVILRDTALILIGGLVEFKDSDQIPFEIDVNELSLTVDEFINTTNTILNL